MAYICLPFSKYISTCQNLKPLEGTDFFLDPVFSFGSKTLSLPYFGRIGFYYNYLFKRLINPLPHPIVPRSGPHRSLCEHEQSSLEMEFNNTSSSVLCNTGDISSDLCNVRFLANRATVYIDARTSVIGPIGPVPYLSSLLFDKINNFVDCSQQHPLLNYSVCEFLKHRIDISLISDDVSVFLRATITTRAQDLRLKITVEVCDRSGVLQHRILERTISHTTEEPAIGGIVTAYRLSDGQEQLSLGSHHERMHSSAKYLAGNGFHVDFHNATSKDIRGERRVCMLTKTRNEVDLCTLFDRTKVAIYWIASLC